MDFRKFDDSVILGSLIFLMAIPVGAYLEKRDKDKLNGLVNKVSIVADSNSDGFTSGEEWAKVYQEAGLRYDASLSNPRVDLTKSQLTNYLSGHDKSQSDIVKISSPNFLR